ncbi:MAG: quinolinate synthase NadA [Clostridia bacterium]|nr:quinolinate synthase NadA [Clostridia bacterium]
MIRDLQDRILQLKKEKDCCILAHSYMSEDICEIADFTGDSYALSVKAKSMPQSMIVMCGVRFMAETAKMLSPDKKVYLANGDAGCPMAEQMSVEYIESLKKQLPGYAVVAYVNTTAELKAISDYCCTSSSAVKICRSIPEQNILFIPDRNLGSYVKAQVPEKTFRLLDGGCPAHAAMKAEDALAAKKAHPGALLLVHPECPAEVSALADYVGSTAGIMTFAEKSDAREFIIGTENAIVEHLQYKCPDKSFYPMSKHLVCSNMKLTTLTDVYNTLKGCGGEEIIMDPELISKAVKCIDRMIEYGG